MGEFAWLSFFWGDRLGPLLANGKLLKDRQASWQSSGQEQQTGPK